MSHRPRFSEWQHPDVKSFLRADASRERAVASQARALLAFSALVPLLARLARATVGVGATLAASIDALSGAAALFAVYRLALISLAGARGGGGADGSAAARAGRAAAASETDLSPAQRRLVGGARARRSPRDAEVDPAFKRLDLDDDGARMRGDASGKPRRRRFGATSRDAAYDGTSAPRGPADGPLFVGISAFLPARRGEGAMYSDGDEDGGSVFGTRGDGTRGDARGYAAGYAENAENARRGDGEIRGARDERFGGFGRADGSAAGTRRVDAADDDAFEAHVRHLGDAVDASFDAAEPDDGAFGGSPGGRGAPGAPWSRGATPGSGGAYGSRDGSRVSPLYGGHGAPGSARSFGGSPGGRYQFRPSPPPRARASPASGAGGPGARAAGAAGDVRGDLERDGPSATDVFASLHPEGAAMADVWADRLREWFAFRVLQPLARVLERSHEDVARTLEALGETDFPRPRPLLSADDAHGDRERAGYSARGAETAGALEQDAMVLEQMRVRLEAALAHARAQLAAAPAFGGGGGGLFGGGGGGLFGGGGGFGASPQQQQQQQQQRSEKEHQVGALAAASDAIVTHCRLIALLRAELPRGLLPVTPPGYVARRVAELAEGSCVSEFAHDAGGDWGSERWSGDLPNDAQLMCYLFCAFLETPGWTFAREGAATPEGSRGGVSHGAGGGGALYFARPPPPHVERFGAVLSTRPPSAIKEGGCAVVMPRSASPAFAVYCGAVGDDAPRVFDGPNGVWRALAALALHARERNGGVMGTTRMAAANVALDSVFMPGRTL